MDAGQAALLICIAAGLVIIITFLTWCLCDVMRDEYNDWQDNRRALAEAELDVASEQLRQTIVALAEELAADRDGASRALTKAMFLTTGRIDHFSS